MADIGMRRGRGPLPIPRKVADLFDRPMARVSGAVSSGYRRRVAALRRRPSAAISAVLVACLVGGGAAYAITSDEYPVRDLQLHDNGIWVSNRDQGQVARYNTQAVTTENLVDLGETGQAIDVRQDDASVLVIYRDTGRFAVLDPVKGTLGTPIKPRSKPADVELGGQTAAMIDGAGKVWVQPFAQVASLGQGPEQIKDAGVGAALAVGTNGDTYVASPAHAELLVIRKGSTDVQRTKLPGLSGSSVQVTAVGDQPVVLDQVSGGLWLPGGKGPGVATSNTDRPVLQQPGASAADVLVSTGTKLLSIPLDGKGPQKPLYSAGSGDPARPVWLSGCAYGAWTSGLSWVSLCAGSPPNEGTFDGKPDPDDELVYRQNRGSTMLNNLRNGALLAPDKKNAKVQDWSSLDASAQTQSQRTDKKENDQQKKAQHNTTKNRPPVAKADTVYGTRPDRSVVVRALDNDTDPNGDILSIDPKLGSVSNGRAAVIENGQAIQVTPDDGDADPVTFTYQVTDPGGLHDQGQVTVNLDEGNAAPARRPTASTALSAKVESGHRVEVNVLGAFYDPNNDPMTVQLDGQPATGSASVTPSGILTYLDNGSGRGLRKISFQVRDDRKLTARDSLSINVLPDGARAPVTHTDVASGFAGQSITAFPLVNDVDLANHPLTLTKIGSGGLDAHIDPSQTRIDVENATPGSHLISYQASNGTKSATGRLRVDVAKDDGGDVPVAVDDSVFVPASGSADVDLLANDVDPDGKVLVVQDVKPAGKQADVAQVRFAVLEHRMLRVWTKAQLDKPVKLTYDVSNGTRSVRAAVLVSAPGAATANQQPVAMDDAAVVRVGDVVDVPALANDTDPDGDHLTLGRELTQVGTAGGVVTTRGDVIRFQAPSVAGSVTVTYGVSDPAGDQASARVVFTVRPDVTGQNSPPSPPELVGRALAGETVRLPLPSVGLDPDGDSVVVTGAASPPKLGAVSVEDGNTLVYKAYDGAQGTDTFSYQVADARGETATAQVRVGVAERAASAGNNDPVAVDDALEIWPQRAVSVPVLDNDVDTDGDTLHVATDRPLQVVPKAAGTAVVKDDRVEVMASKAGTMSVGYTVTDGHGGESTAFLALTVDPRAPLQPPVARDDTVPVDSPARATVKVLGNDDDPDGRAADLTVKLVGPHAGAGTVAPGGVVIVTRTPAAMTVAYQVTDLDGKTATAFVWAPGTANQPPHLKSGVRLTVKTGDTAQISLAKVVVDPEGSAVRLAHTSGDDAVSAARGQAKVAGSGALSYQAPSQAGDDGVSFEVVDSPGRSSEARTALITVPVSVTSPSSTPAFHDTQLKLTTGETARRLDLRSFVTEPGAASGVGYRFSVQNPQKNVATVGTKDDHFLVVTPKSAGTTTVAVRVQNAAGRSGTGHVSVKVTDAARALPLPHDFTVTGAQGKPVVIDWQANITAPPGAQLRVYGQPAVAPTQAGRATMAGQVMTFRPSDTWAGQVLISYSVVDLAAKPRQAVAARAFVVIKGKPGAPGTPAVLQQSAGAVTLAWTPAASNGAPIDHYEVVSKPAGKGKQCAQTTCEITALENEQSYTFSVYAVNSVGRGLSSGESQSVAIDNRPDAPGTPVAQFVAGGTGGSIAVSWPAVAVAGGGKVAYQVTGTPGVAAFDTADTSHTFTGLTNGTAYAFKVRAAVGGANSDYSPLSAPETPAGVPDPPVITSISSEGGKAVVTWTAPNTNGALVTGYNVKSAHGDVVGTATGFTGLTASIEVGTIDSYQFSVQAINKSGISAFGPVKTFVPEPTPGAIATLTAKDGDERETLTFAVPTGKVTRYEYQQNAGDWKALPDSNVITGLTNGTTYNFRVRACSTACGAASPTANDAVPYGLPGKPDVTSIFGRAPAVGYTKVRVGCGTGKSNGREVESSYRIDGGTWVSCSKSSYVDFQRYDQEISEVARTVDSEGQVVLSETWRVGFYSPTYSYYPPGVAPNTGAGCAVSDADCLPYYEVIVITYGPLVSDGATVYPLIRRTASGQCQMDSTHPLKAKMDGRQAGDKGDESYLYYVQTPNYAHDGIEVCGFHLKNEWDNSTIVQN